MNFDITAYDFYTAYSVYQFNSGATIKLINAISGVEIVGSNVEVHPHSQIIADFDLTNVELGEWNLIITNGDGESVSQIKGFNITRP